MTRMVKPRAWVLEFWSEIPLPKPTPKRERTVYTEAQEASLYRQMREFDILFCRLAYLLGIREGQMVTLRWEDVAWHAQALALPAFKKHRARTIPLSMEALAILGYWWQQQGQPMRGWVCPDLVGNQHLLRPAETDVHMDYHNWYNRHFLKAIHRADLAGLGLDFHTLRHTWTTRLGDKIPTRVLQFLGGWSDLKLVERYAKNALSGTMLEAMEHASTFGSEGAKEALKAILEVPRPYIKVIDN